MKNLLLTAALLTGCFCVHGQEDQPETVTRISINDFYVYGGFGSQGNAAGTLADFRVLAPGSALLNNDLTGYSASDGYGMTENTMFSVMLGIRFSNRQRTAYRTNPELRLGISYFSVTSLTANLYREDRSPYDTLTSSQTGQTVYIDSVTMTNYGMDYSSDQLRLDGSLIFRTNPQARWSLYGGIGITAGMSINSQTDVLYDETERTEADYSSNGYYSPNSYSGYEAEVFTNRNGFGLSAYIPMGIDFRMGKKREFWKRLHLFYEFRPGIDITSIPALRTIAAPNVQHGLGIKVSWD